MASTTAPRARKESSAKFANDGSLESVRLQLEKMTGMATHRVESLGLPMNRDDVRQELMTGYVCAKNTWKVDSGVLFVTYMTRVCWNNFNSAIYKMERDRTKLGLVSNSELTPDDAEDDWAPSWEGAIADPAGSADARLDAVANLREAYEKVSPDTRLLLNALLQSSARAGAPSKLRDIANSLGLTGHRLTDVRREIADNFGVRWL